MQTIIHKFNKLGEMKMKMPVFFAQLILMLCLSFNAQAETLSLKDCLNEAMNNNPALKEARLNISASEESMSSAIGRYYPRISLEANYTVRQDPVPYIPAQSPTIAAHFSDKFASWAALMTMPLYQGGQIANNVELANIRKGIVQNTFKLTKHDIIANTVITYYKLIQTTRLKEASSATLKALQEQLNNSKLMFEVGRIAKVDLLKIEAQYSNEHQRMLVLTESQKTLSALLRFLMGRQRQSQEDIISPTDELAITKREINFSEGLALAKSNRPEYQNAKRSVQEAEKAIEVALGKMLPSVSAFSGYLKQYGFNPSYNEGNWFAGINLSLPLFEKPLHSEYRREQIQKQRTLERLKTLENQLVLDVQTAMSSLMDSLARIEATQKAVAQAQEAFRIEQEKFKTGAGTVTDLLFAQASAMTAEVNYTQALFDYNLALTSWRKSTGTLEEYLK